MNETFMLLVEANEGPVALYISYQVSTIKYDSPPLEFKVETNSLCSSKVEHSTDNRKV